MRSIAVFALIVVALLAAPQGRADPAGKPSGAQQRTWAQEKCFRYKRDWREALRRWGTAGLSLAFIDANQAFIDSGCESDAKICALSPREREIVDVLAIRVVNEGMSTTFLPFGCPD